MTYKSEGGSRSGNLNEIEDFKVILEENVTTQHCLAVCKMQLKSREVEWC